MDNRPLAEQLRPQTIHEIVGQAHLLEPGRPLSRMLAQKPSSFVLWGPPGTGKTTLAHAFAANFSFPLVTMSATFSGVAELRKVFEAAQKQFLKGTPTIPFVDEIHRFNRAQQDSFLPYMEKGDIILIGATTENPSFELNGALLSRCQVFTLKRLEIQDLEKIYERAEHYLGKTLPLTPDAKSLLINMADGDGRFFLNLIEIISTEEKSSPLSPQDLANLLAKRMPLYDKARDEHYNLISALHKSLRGSDVDAALYWFARMLQGGEDPLYIGRRLIRFAAEDIGMSDPQALIQALAGVEAYERLGSPEGELVLVQALVYLATAPKSNALYTAYSEVRNAAKQSGSLVPPKHILNAPTALMKQEGYGKDYHYDHDTSEGFSGQNYFPENLPRQTFYKPVERGFEREIRKRLDYWNKLREGSLNKSG